MAAVPPSGQGAPASAPNYSPAPDTMAAVPVASVRADTIPAGQLRQATPAEVFGAASVRGEQPQAGETSTLQTAYAETLPFSSGVVFQSATLFVAVGYCLLLYYFRSCVVELAKLLRSKLYTEKLLSEANHTFAAFLDLISGLGVVGSAIAILRMAEIAAGLRLERLAGGWFAEFAVPILASVLGLMTLYRWAGVRIAGDITFSGEAAIRFWELRKMSMALATLFGTPLLLLLAVNHGGGQAGMMWIMGGGIFLAAGFLLYKTYVFFIEQNFSILNWILYLCAIEILPISLIIGLIIRNS